MLTKALLKVDFSLDVLLPKGKLCPTVTNRLDYLHLIEDLLDSGSVDYKTNPIAGLDIGTGASCIYPLLGCAMHANWKFIATEIDEVSFESAKENVQRNKLIDRIDLHKVDDSNTPLLTLLRDQKVDFCMCNPPFYSSNRDIINRRTFKRSDPLSFLEYTENESVCPGGEVAFVSRIIEESVKLQPDQCIWYTSMLGLKSSVSVLEEKLQKTKMPQVKILSSLVGNTKRWVLAWSLQKGYRKRKLRNTRKIKFKFIPDQDRVEGILANLMITKDHNDYITDRKTWTRRAQRSIGRGELASLEECKLRFKVEFSGKIIGFVLIEGDYDGLNSLVNHLRHRLLQS